MWRRISSNCSLVLVTKSYLQRGRQVINCWDPNTGHTWVAVPVLSQGGGKGVQSRVVIAGAGKKEAELLANPERTNRPQAILIRHGVARSPYCVGFIPHSKSSLNKGSAGGDEESDRKDGLHEDDTGWELGGGVVALDKNGSFTVNVNKSKHKIMRLQGGVFRVSLSGSAPDRLMLASTSLTYLAALEQYVSALQSRVAAIETWALAVQHPPYVDTEIPQPELPDSATSKLKSKRIHISSESED